MRASVFIYFLAAFLTLFTGTHLKAQKAKPIAVKTSKAYPSSFIIDKSEFDNLLSCSLNSKVISKKNKYMDKSVLLMNSQTGDMKFLKFKLDYFKNALLMVQVNGSYSTQVFIMSDDNSVFYKGEFIKNDVVMTKCQKDDIMSE